jgi:hypothetical protein
MNLDLERIRKNARNSSTEDLLDRITVYRVGMEAAAIEIIETELDRRGIRESDIRQHGESRSGTIKAGEIARRCSLCHRPAVVRAWGWHRLWGRLPIFPRRFLYCDVHRRNRRGDKSTSS